MFFSKLFSFSLLLGMVAAVVSMLPQDAFAQGGGDRIRLVARIQGVNARAKYEERDSGTRRKFNFQLEKSTPGWAGTVTATTASGTVDLGSFTVDSLGRGIIDIDTNEGDSVPQLAVGDTITLNLNGSTYSGVLQTR